MNIKVNGVTISIENGNTIVDPDFNELDSMSKSIESLGAQIDNDVIAYKLISNVKAVESFGYKSTEGVGQAIGNAAKTVGRKIVEFFKRVLRFFQKIGPIISTKLVKGRLKSAKAKELLNDGSRDNVGQLINWAESFLTCIKTSTKEINKLISGMNKDYNTYSDQIKKQEDLYRKVVKVTGAFASATNALFSSNNDRITDAMQKVRDIGSMDQVSEVNAEVQKVFNSWNSFKKEYLNRLGNLAIRRNNDKASKKDDNSKKKQ